MWSVVRGVRLSFSGCGFLGVYQAGALHAFRTHPEPLEVVAAHGSSAGALVAAAAVVGLPTELLLEQFALILGKVRARRLGALTPGFYLTEELEACLAACLPHDAHTLATGRLHVSLTTPTFGSTVTSFFPTRPSLLSALLCSCHIPLYSGPSLPSHLGSRYMDGGLTEQLPGPASATRVSPFAGGGKEVSPAEAAHPSVSLAGEEVALTRGNLVRGWHALAGFPPHLGEHYYRRGLEDARRFLQLPSSKLGYE